MVQKINITNLILKNNHLTIKLEFKFKNKENHSPKLQIIFFNDNETRRFTFDNITYNKDSNNEYFVSTEKSFDLEHVFWNNYIGDIYTDFSLLFGEEFIENFLVEQKSEFNNKSKNYFAELKNINGLNKNIGSKLVFKANRDVLKEIEKNVKNYSPLLYINRFFLVLLAIISFPFFLIDGFLASKGLVKKSSYYLKGDSTLKSILFHVNWRTNNYAKFIYGRRTLNISLMKLFYFFTKYRKVKNNKIAFLSERTDDLNGNFEFVYNFLKENEHFDKKNENNNLANNETNKPNKNLVINKDYDDLEIAIFLKNKPIRDLNFFEMIKFVNIISTSKIILLDDFYPNIHNFNLKKNIELIQLWHAVGAFKTFGFSRLGKPGGTPQESPNHRNYDYAIVSSNEIRRFYSEGFGISDEKVVATGIPRTDIFFNEQYNDHITKKLYNKYPAFKDKKTILFAPTFRGEGKIDAFYPLDKFNIEEFFHCLNNPRDYILIIKQHPFVRDKVKIPEKYKDNVIDLSNESNINDLLFITDILITDYSSVIFEAALLNIPMLFYAYDLAEYTIDRGFYYDYDVLVPGKIVQTFEKLIESINNNDFEEFKINSFKNKFFNDLEGKSTERACNLILKLINNEFNINYK